MEREHADPAAAPDRLAERELDDLSLGPDARQPPRLVDELVVDLQRELLDA